MSEMTHKGQCHCGALGVEFRTSVPTDELTVRECQCSFCRKQGGRSCTDPNGHVTFIAHDKSLLNRYRFGKKITDFLVCRGCGAYVGAVMEIGGKLFATLNVNSLDGNPLGDRHGGHADYDGETATSAAERRARVWTPAELR